jgi:hypothetical protein
LIERISFAEEQRREDAELTDRRLQVLQRNRIDHLARLVRVRPQIRDGDLVEIALFVLRCCKHHGRQPPVILVFTIFHPHPNHPPIYGEGRRG